MRRTADFPTSRPQPLLGTMCKHFAHKIAVEQDGTGAVLRFPWGVARAEAGEAGLHLTVEAADEAAFARIRDVLIGHLQRWAAREEPQAPAWRDA